MKFVFHINLYNNHTAKVSEVIEVPDDELEGLDDEEQGRVIQSYFDDWAPNHADMGWYPVEWDNGKSGGGE